MADPLISKQPRLHEAKLAMTWHCSMRKVLSDYKRTQISG
jgi:hypothetical protein